MADDIRLVLSVDDRDLIRTQKEQKKFERNLLTIESAFRKGDITAKRYASELNKQAKQLSMLGGSYNKANSEVRKYAVSLRKATDDQLRMAQATNMAGKSTNRFGMYAQQVGYQVGDFFVQVQSGTSALVAFGQQGTQLAGLLPGLAGAILGIGLSVGTMLLRTFSQAKEASNETSASIKAFEESLKSAKEETASMAQELLVLEGGFTGVSEAALDAAVKKTKEAVAKAQEEFTIESRFLLEGFDLSKPDDMEDYLDLMQDYTDALQDAKDAQKAAEKDYLDFRLNQQAIANEKGKAYISEMVDLFRQSFLEITQMDKKSIEERSDAVAQGIEIFRAAQKRMRDEDAAKTQKTLDSIFKSRTLFYSIRFKGEEGLMEQSLTPSGKIGMSYEELLAAGVPHDTIVAMGVKPPKTTKTPKAKESDLKKLQKQLKLESALVGQTEARQRVIQALGLEFSKKNPQTVASLEKQIQLTKELIQEEQQRKDLIDFVADSMGDSFMSMVEGTKSVKDAFREMASDIVRELYRVLVVQQMVNSAKTFLGGFFADGGAFSGGSQIQAYADGGVVGSPTYFGMSGGKTGLMGEAGPEAIMPLSRGANGKLGVQAEGVGGVTINQNINISTGVQQTVRSEIKSMMPQIAEQSKAAVLDAKRRGGSYGGKF